MTYLVVSSMVTLSLVAGLLLVSVFSSHWLRIGRLNRSRLCSCTLCDCGILYACQDRDAPLEITGDKSECSWFMAGDESKQSLPDWFKASQTMMAVALGMCTLSIVVALCSLCAPYVMHIVVTIATTITAVLMTISVCVFGGKIQEQEEAGIIVKGFDHLPYLSWSFWLTVAGAMIAWVAAILYCVLSRLKFKQYFV